LNADELFLLICPAELCSGLRIRYLPYLFIFCTVWRRDLRANEARLRWVLFAAFGCCQNLQRSSQNRPKVSGVHRSK